MNYTITTYSNRMYDLNSDIKEAIDKTTVAFCRGVYSSYNDHFSKKYDAEAFNKKHGDTSLHLINKKRINCDTYYANSITQEAKGKLVSQIELNKIYIKDKEESLKAIDKKIREEQNKLAAYQKTLLNLYDYRNKVNDNPKAKLKVSRFKHIGSNGYMITVRIPSKDGFLTTEYGLFAFEYDYLLPKIKFTKNKISQLKIRKNHVIRKLESLEKPKRIVFGGKYNLRNLSYNELMNKKYNEFCVSGRKDAKYGNFVFKATPLENGNFNIKFHLMDNKEYELKNIQFPYHGKELTMVLNKDVPNKEMTPICFGIVRKIDALGREYYQFKVSFNIGSTKRYNTDTSTGCFGMDFNHGHLDVTEIDEKGNLVNQYVIPYQTDGTSKENEISLRQALNQVGLLVSKKNKILVVEKLDTSTSKRKSTYRDKKTNRIFHMFPYARYLEFVEYVGFKYGFEITRVAPAYTSVIGLIKYKEQMKLSTHIAAAFVIARRGVKYSHNEKVPKRYKPIVQGDYINKHYWAKFNKINKEIKKQNS